MPLLAVRELARRGVLDLSQGRLFERDGKSMSAIPEQHYRRQGPNILEVVRLSRDDLRKSERKVADLVLVEPQKVLAATVAEVAKFARDPFRYSRRRSSFCGCRENLRIYDDESGLGTAPS
jgi:hypothetical protein